MEAKNTEKEASASLLENIVEENEIEGLLVDLDNTVLHTSEYYIETEESLSFDLAENFIGNMSSEYFANTMAGIMKKQYLERNGKPILVVDRYMTALKEFLGSNEAKKYENIVTECFKNFYEISPEIIDGALEFSREIMRLRLPYIYTSNAQEDWTIIKVRGFEEELGVQEIKYNAIDIDKVKNEEDWVQSSRIINIPIEKTLIFGDSLESDILAGIRAGCRNLVWIGGNLEKLPIEIRENPNIHIWCVNSIKDLL